MRKSKHPSGGLRTSIAWTLLALAQWEHAGLMPQLSPPIHPGAAAQEAQGDGDAPPLLVLCAVQQLLSSVPRSLPRESIFWVLLCYFSFLECNMPLPIGSFFSLREEF